MKNRIQAMKKTGRHVVVAVSLAVFVATTAEAGNTWDGGSGANAAWSTAANWTGDALPAFGSTLDIYFYAVGAGNTLTNYLGTTAYTVRSLNFTADADSDVFIRLANGATGNTARNLSFGGSGGAAITTDPGAAGNFTIGVGGTGSAVVLLDNLTITHNAPGSLTINRPMTGGYGLTCNGTGVVSLTAVNTYSNATLITGGGAVVISADSGLGTAPATPTPGQLCLTNGALATTASFTLDPNRGVALSGAGGQFNAYSGTLAVGGIIAGAGGLEKAGAGGLTLTNANTYTGGTLLSAGTLTINNDNGIGTGLFTINGGTVSSTGNTITNAITINSDFTISGNSGVTVPTFTGPVSLGTAAGTSRTITESATSSGTGSPSISGAISDGLTAKKLIKAGAGGLSLTATNSTFTGGVDLNGGLLSVNSSGALGAGTLTIGDGTTVSVPGSNARTITNSVVVNGNFTWSLAGKAALSMSGPVSLGSANRTITVANIHPTSTHTISGTISGSGGLTVLDNVVAASTNDLALTGNNNFTGDLTVGNTVNLAVNSDAAMGAGTNIVITQNGRLVPTASFATGKRVTLQGSSGGLTVGSGLTLTLNGPVDGTGAAGQFVKEGTGIMALNNAGNAWKVGEYLLMSGGGVSLGHSNALNGALLKYNGGNKLDNVSGTAMTANGMQGLSLTSGFTFTGSDDLDLSGTPCNFVQTAAAKTLNVAAKTLTLSGILSTGTDAAGGARFDAPLVKTGDGTLVIKGASDYTKGTTVTAGTLRLAADNALPPGGDVTLSGGTLDMGAYACSPSSLNVSTNSSLVLGTGQLSFTSQTNAWAGRLTIFGDLSRLTLHFQPALTAAQLGQIDLSSGKFYQTSDGYLHNYPKGTLIRVL